MPPLLPPPSQTEQGRGIGASVALIPAAWGLGGGSGVREKRGSDPRPHLVPGWSEAAGRREPAAAGEEGCGGGAVWLGRDLEAAVELVGVGSCAGSPFIGQVRWWGGR